NLNRVIDPTTDWASTSTFFKACTLPPDEPVFLLDPVRQEQAAVQVLDLAEELLGLGGSLPLWFGESLEEERLKELGVEAVLSPRLGFLQLIAQIGLVPSVEEPG